jgi:hypothetical protein
LAQFCRIREKDSAAQPNASVRFPGQWPVLGFQGLWPVLAGGGGGERSRRRDASPLPRHRSAQTGLSSPVPRPHWDPVRDCVARDFDGSCASRGGVEGSSARRRRAPLRQRLRFPGTEPDARPAPSRPRAAQVRDAGLMACWWGRATTKAWLRLVGLPPLSATTPRSHVLFAHGCTSQVYLTVDVGLLRAPDEDCGPRAEREGTGVFNLLKTAASLHSFEYTVHGPQSPSSYS